MFAVFGNRRKAYYDKGIVRAKQDERPYELNNAKQGTHLMFSLALKRILKAE